MHFSSDRPTAFEGFQADGPTELPDHDFLGRVTFAKKLAESIAAWKQKDSLSIGLEQAENRKPSLIHSQSKRTFEATVETCSQRRNPLPKQ